MDPHVLLGMTESDLQQVAVDLGQVCSISGSVQLNYKNDKNILYFFRLHTGKLQRETTSPSNLQKKNQRHSRFYSM